MSCRVLLCGNIDKQQHQQPATHMCIEFYCSHQVVPTDYEDIKGRSTHSNQFSVTENFRESADAHLGGRSLPGVFFFYDLSPIKVGRLESGISAGWRVSGWHTRVTTRARSGANLEV